MTLQRRQRRVSRVVMALALAATPIPGRADVQVVDVASLETALAAAPFCCVVDARVAAARHRDPVPEARLWPHVGSIATGHLVVVLADTPDAARQVAGQIAKRQGTARVLVARGGVADWRIVAAGRAALPPPGMRFIIPRNTCDPATVIMEMRGADSRKTQ